MPGRCQLDDSDKILLGSCFLTLPQDYWLYGAMRSTTTIRALIGPSLLSLLTLSACDQDNRVQKPNPSALAGPSAAAPAKPTIDASKLALFKALPSEVPNPKNAENPDKIALGRVLYYETRLSKDNTISCNSCHVLDKFGVDNQPTSEGVGHVRGDRNSPTVYNAAGHFVQFWDGREPDVEAQAKGPITNPKEMALADGKAVVASLKKIKGYQDLFKKAFPEDKDPITYDNVGRAIGAFERKLLTPSRWDKFIAGDQNALSDAEKAGFNKFTEVGCTACHMGPYVGGQMFQKLGLVKPYESKDLGRFAVTKQEADKFMFKVPSLRNVEKTAPYFHDGSVATLEQAVKLMANHQLGRELNDADTASIIAWLKSLTGELPTDYIQKPEKMPS